VAAAGKSQSTRFAAIVGRCIKPPYRAGTWQTSAPLMDRRPLPVRCLHRREVSARRNDCS
jgi:hypothetical protein